MLLHLICSLCLSNFSLSCHLLKGVLHKLLLWAPLSHKSKSRLFAKVSHRSMELIMMRLLVMLLIWLLFVFSFLWPQPNNGICSTQCQECLLEWFSLCRSLYVSSTKLLFSSLPCLSSSSGLIRPQAVPSRLVWALSIHGSWDWVLVKCSWLCVVHSSYLRWYCSTSTICWWHDNYWVWCFCYFWGETTFI